MSLPLTTGQCICLPFQFGSFRSSNWREIRGEKKHNYLFGTSKHVKFQFFYVYLYDRSSGTRSTRICSGTERVRHVYLSRGNHMEVRIVPKKNQDVSSQFLLKYEGKGGGINQSLLWNQKAASSNATFWPLRIKHFWFPFLNEWFGNELHWMSNDSLLVIIGCKMMYIS